MIRACQEKSVERRAGVGVGARKGAATWTHVGVLDVARAQWRRLVQGVQKPCHGN